LSITVTTSTAVVEVTAPNTATVITSGSASARIDISQQSYATNLVGVEFISEPAWIQLNTEAVANILPGRIGWNADQETVSLGLDDDVTINLGQDDVIRVKNNSGSVAIPKFTLVMFAGAVGDTVKVSPAITDGSVPHEYMVGITAEVIPADGFGFVKTNGTLQNVNTAAYSLGTILYADPTVPGGFTATKPEAPNLKLPIAAVTRVQAQSGRVLVRMTGGLSVNELHDVQTNGKTDGDALVWDAANNYWTNAVVFGEPTELSIGTVTTGTAGSTATATVTGEPPSQTISFVIPRGDKGETGSPGLDGQNGIDGINGQDGINGLDGEDGASAYQVAQANGFTGTELEWLASLVGAQGPEGPAGADSTVAGPQGPQGEPGADSTVPGPQGPAGADSTVPGPEGPQGPAGADSTVPGPQGPAGADSTVPGPQGETGPTGPSGVIAATSPLAYDSETQTVSLSSTTITINGTAISLGGTVTVLAQLG
jgi:hypothetical protein